MVNQQTVGPGGVGWEAESSNISLITMTDSSAAANPSPVVEMDDVSDTVADKEQTKINVEVVSLLPVAGPAQDDVRPASKENSKAGQLRNLLAYWCRRYQPTGRFSEVLTGVILLATFWAVAYLLLGNFLRNAGNFINCKFNVNFNFFTTGTVYFMVYDQRFNQASARLFSFCLGSCVSLLVSGIVTFKKEK
jgi:hypothetical protein